MGAIIGDGFTSPNKKLPRQLGDMDLLFCSRVGLLRGVHDLLGRHWLHMLPSENSANNPTKSMGDMIRYGVSTEVEDSK